MWVFTNNAFVSITTVPHLQGIGLVDNDHLQIRARRPEDLIAFFDDDLLQIYHTENTDYPSRTYATRQRVAEALSRTVHVINYANFKGSVKDHERHMAYLGVWGVMRRWQDVVERSLPWSRRLSGKAKVVVQQASRLWPPAPVRTINLSSRHYRDDVSWKPSSILDDPLTK